MFLPERPPEPRAQMFSRNDSGKPEPIVKQEIAKKPYQFLMVNVLREYLEKDLAALTPFSLDKERIYDDFGAWGNVHVTRSIHPELLH